LKKNNSTRSVRVQAVAIDCDDNASPLRRTRVYNNPAGLLARANAGASIWEIPGFLALEDAVMQREQDSVTP
jgi:hypothetical protein